MSSKEIISPDQLEDSGSIDISSVLPPEPHPPIPIPIPDPTGIALLLFAIIGVSELGRAATRGKA